MKLLIAFSAALLAIGNVHSQEVMVKTPKGYTATATEECPLTESDKKFLGVAESQKHIECMALTDKKPTHGRPLTLPQLLQAYGKLKSDSAYDMSKAFPMMQANALGKKVTCLAITGDMPLCSCYARSLPMFVSFDNAVSMLIGKPDVGPTELKVDQKEFERLVVLVRATREKCVGAIE